MVRNFIKYYSTKNGSGIVFFEKISFTYTKPKKDLDHPFCLVYRAKPTDFFDKKDFKWKKIPNLKKYCFGAYSKWGIAPCV